MTDFDKFVAPTTGYARFYSPVVVSPTVTATTGHGGSTLAPQVSCRQFAVFSRGLLGGWLFC